MPGFYFKEEGMPTDLNIGVQRKPTANIARSNSIRERVLDHLNSSGGRISPERMSDARLDLVRCAIRIGRERNLRLWRGRQGVDDYDGILSSGLKSLEVLLGEKSNITPGSNGSGAKRRTGVNANWVLDLWEAVLDHHHREPLYRDRTPEPITPPTVDEARSMNESGPVMVALPPPQASLSSRMLDAYLSRDDEAMMRLAIEVEAMEAQA